MTRYVADVGNTRVKLGRLAPDGSIAATCILAADDPGTWTTAEGSWWADARASWAIASVNPPVAGRLIALIERSGGSAIRPFRSAADVPVRHALATPHTTGADRALAVLAALHRHPDGGPGLVVSCGTAVTVERIGPDGLWHGGAIAPGLVSMAEALSRTTAQLPRVAVDAVPPAPWGAATAPALAAGIFWGVVGVIRELLARQAEGFDRPPWRIWTGGDAPTFARLVEGEDAVIVPDLVLEGLARAAFR